MPDLALALLVFLVVGSGFLFIHLMIGKVVRPSRPGHEKGTIYECGEPTVGSAWIQFDLRYYVVALLFVVFDVEVAFFFPWAIVFGTANEYAKTPTGTEASASLEKSLKLESAGLPLINDNVDKGTLSPESAHEFAWIAFGDLLVFFAVLMVGFAYLWRRGDIDWVRVVPGLQPGDMP
ncbi:MAG TPA: NADH-quinone oxidoreductase subunit A [Gemmataceae bacterium]|jgi:NADH-quinone oxidoreductase subunit A|nr:NADH-quinone oxidoreductase subunit A [Gemmataceae bacterium]